MRASIVQLKDLFFQRLSIEPSKALDQVTPGEASGFDFGKVNFRVRLEHGDIVDDEKEPRAFGVTLGISIDNAEGKAAPYKIDVIAVGLIEVSKKVEKEKRSDLALVNGASLIYGAIREMVSMVTSRCLPGPIILPTMDFRDHAEPKPQELTKAATVT